MFENDTRSIKNLICKTTNILRGIVNVATNYLICGRYGVLASSCDLTSNIYTQTLG